MATYFHIAPMTYNAGEDLLSWDRYCETYGEAPAAWKWDEVEVGYDGHMVCLWREDQAQEMRWMIETEMSGECKLLTIVTDEAWERELGFDLNDEGYTSAMYGRIPADVIVTVEVVAA